MKQPYVVEVNEVKYVSQNCTRDVLLKLTTECRRLISLILGIIARESPASPSRVLSSYDVAILFRRWTPPIAVH